MLLLLTSGDIFIAWHRSPVFTTICNKNKVFQVHYSMFIKNYTFQMLFHYEGWVDDKAFLRPYLIVTGRRSSNAIYYLEVPNIYTTIILSFRCGKLVVDAGRKFQRGCRLRTVPIIK